MSRKSSLLALVLVLGLIGVPLAAAPASAAVMSARSSNLTPMAGEVVQLSGVAAPANRRVYLQRYFGHHWHAYRVTRSHARGRVSFPVRALSSRRAYRLYAPATRHHRSLTSRFMWVTPATPQLSLALDNTSIGQPASVASTPSGATSYGIAEGRFTPARRGQVVDVQQLTADGYQSVGKAAQTSTGSFRLPVPTADLGTAAAPRTFRAVTVAVGQTITSADTQPTYRAMSLDDEFDGTSLDATTWQPRLMDACDASDCEKRGLARCTSVVPQSTSNRVSVANGLATLTLSPWKAADSHCPLGHWYDAVVGTGPAGKTYGYGTFAARIRFQHPQGMHGAFWLQGPYVTGAEADVVEYYGEGRERISTSQYIHYIDGQGVLSSAGRFLGIADVLGQGPTPSNGWHIWSVQWSPDRYVFRIDGIPTFVTSKPHVSTERSEVVLSLTAPDWEISRMGSVDTGRAARMDVDWVRAWEY